MRILHVEDDLGFANAFRRYIRSQGVIVEIDQVTNLKDALSAVLQEYDLVVTDGHFPNVVGGDVFFNGDKVATAVIGKGIRIVGLSADTDKFKTKIPLYTKREFRKIINELQ